MLRFLRRWTYCKLGIHCRTTRHDADGICGAWTCNDCGHEHPHMVWPRPPCPPPRDRQRPDFTRMQSVIDLALANGVSVGLDFMECDYTYYWSVHSLAPSENWIGRSKGFDHATDEVCQYLESLLARGNPAEPTEATP